MTLYQSEATAGAYFIMQILSTSKDGSDFWTAPLLYRPLKNDAGDIILFPTIEDAYALRRSLVDCPHLSDSQFDIRQVPPHVLVDFGPQE